MIALRVGRTARASLAAAVAAGCGLACSCATLPAPAPGSSTVAPPPATGAPAPATRPARLTLAGEPWIRVGLAWDEDSVVVSTIQSSRVAAGRHALASRSGRFSIGTADGALHARALDAPGEDRLDAAPGDTLVVEAGDPRRPAFQWRGKTWRGELRVFVNPRGRLTAIARLPLESYLLGVVPGEIGALADDRVEAGRAQSIAARSYTLFYLGRRAAEGFDVYGSVEDQVYGPVETERAIATRCVESTRGQACLSQGWPIRANYGSTCGGITSEVWEAWPVAPLPYLVSRRDREGSADFCAASPHFRWREEWTPGELAANLAKFGPLFGVALPAGGVGDLLEVEATSRSRSGRVWSLTVRTTTGAIVIPAYAIRQVLRRAGNPAAILRSNLFKIDVRRDPATRRALAIVASGAGNGHGAGLCQTGALGMALQGRDAAAILAHYYPTSSLERLY